MRLGCSKIETLSNQRNADKQVDEVEAGSARLGRSTFDSVGFIRHRYLRRLTHWRSLNLAQQAV